MKRIRDILAFFGRMDRGFYPVLVAAALLETLEGFGVLLISSTILNLLVAGAGPESILSATLVMTGGYGALHWLRLLAVRHKDYRQQRLRYRYWCFVVEHVFRLPYWYLEKEDFVETLEQIWQNDRTYDLTMGTLNQAYAMVRSGFSVLVACVSFLRLFGAVRGLGDSAFLVGMLILGLFVLILLSMGYIVWQRKRNAQDMVGFMEEVVKRNKVAMYLLGQVIANYPKGKHIRLYGMQEKLRREQRKQTAGFGHLIAHQGRMELKPGLAGDISSVAISAMVYLTVSAIAMAGGLGAGSIIWYAGVVQQLLESVRRLIGLASELYGNCTRQQVIFGLTEAVKEADSGARGLPSGEEHTLEFRDVSFAYPGSDRMVLEHVDLRISGRERVALVGPNGSGKTTFVKLLCRLYDPTEGVILMNEVDIRKYRYEEYMRLFSVVFQDFQVFSLKMGEYIAGRDGVDEQRALDAVSRAGLTGLLSKMPQGLDTVIGRDFSENGFVVSGGEAQKLAIARAIYKDAPFVILDEPTAALDPVTENEIYTKFHEIIGKKTALFISHRLSACRFAGEILVFEKGDIVQRGSHDALCGQEGLYRRMWEAQAKYYAGGQKA